jgi:histidine triad (HIT) family protein
VATVFTKIIAGELPGHFVWRDDLCVAFLSINPTSRGHTLVVPRAEVDHWLDLDAQVAGHLMEVAHAIGRAQQAAGSAPRVGLMIAGFEVPHVHVHVVPMSSMLQLDLSSGDTSPDPDALAQAAEEIRAALRKLGHAEVSD